MVEGKIGAVLGSKLCVAVGVFKRDVLRIQPSDCHKTLSEPRIHIKEVSPEAQEIPRHGSGDLLTPKFGT